MNNFTRYAKDAEGRGSKDLARRIRIEGRMCAALVTAALDRYCTVSVNDGEEWTVKRSTSKTEIMDALFTTDSDHVQLYDKDGNKLGWFSLIYGNDGTDVISDYSANDFCEAIWNEVIQPLADKIDSGR